jgi:hypothetical protein
MNDEIQFVQPVYDRWLQALNVSHVRVIDEDKSEFNVSYYAPAEPVTVLACAKQMQWCNSNLQENEACTPVQGTSPGSCFGYRDKVPDDLRLNSQLKVVFLRLYDAAYTNSIINIAD